LIDLAQTGRAGAVGVSAHGRLAGWPLAGHLDALVPGFEVQGQQLFQQPAVPLLVLLAQSVLVGAQGDAQLQLPGALVALGAEGQLGHAAPSGVGLLGRCRWIVPDRWPVVQPCRPGCRIPARDLREGGVPMSDPDELREALETSLAENPDDRAAHAAYAD